jgi:hypothetical protein
MQSSSKAKVLAVPVILVAGSGEMRIETIQVVEGDLIPAEVNVVMPDISSAIMLPNGHPANVVSARFLHYPCVVCGMQMNFYFQGGENASGADAGGNIQKSEGGPIETV